MMLNRCSLLQCNLTVLIFFTVIEFVTCLISCNKRAIAATHLQQSLLLLCQVLLAPEQGYFLGDWVYLQLQYGLILLHTFGFIIELCMQFFVCCLVINGNNKQITASIELQCTFLFLVKTLDWNTEQVSWSIEQVAKLFWMIWIQKTKQFMLGSCALPRLISTIILLL